MSVAATPRSSGDGQSLMTAGQIVASARQLEEKVARLRGEAECYKGKALRWEELRGARMLSRREAAAADLVYEKGRRAAGLEKTARHAKLTAFAGQKATEQAAAANAQQLCVAGDAARRIEEQLAEARRNLELAKQQAAAAEDETCARCESVRAGAEARLREAERAAEERISSIDQAVIEETLRADAAIKQEQEQLERRYFLREKAAQRQRLKMEQEVKVHEVEADAAERKRDRSFVEVQRSAERSNFTARAKVKRAIAEQDHLAQSTLLRKNHMQLETGMRLQQAKAREVAAEQALEARRARAEVALRLAKQKEAAVEAECAEVIRIQTEWVDNLRHMLAAKIAEWDASVLDAEAVARERVDAIQELASEVKRRLAGEVHESQEHVNEELRRIDAMASSDRGLVDGQLAALAGLTAEAQALAERRVEEVHELSTSQHRSRTRLAEAAEEQSQAQLGQVRQVLDGRVRQEVSLLMSYFEASEEQRPASTSSSECPEDLLPWMPQHIGGGFPRADAELGGGGPRGSEGGGGG